MDKNKKVLILCHDFPPVNRIAARRPAAWAKYLPNYGWEPVIITATEPGRSSQPMSPEEVLRWTGGVDAMARVNMPARSRFKILRIASELWDLTVFPLSYSRLRTRRAIPVCHVEFPNIDVVLCTYPETWPLLAARNISRNYKRPWVADFRDLPYQLPIPRWMGQAAVRRVRQLTQDAAHVIAVSDVQADMLRLKSRPVSVIPNGFDPDILPHEPRASRHNVFEIVYTGLMVRGQSVRPVVDAVDALVRSGHIPSHRIDIRFYGTQLEAFRSQIDSEGLVKHPILMPKVSATESLCRQRSATALLVLQLTDPDKAAGVFTGKVYEYLAAGRPILSYPSDSNGISRLLSVTGAGISCQNEGELLEVILRWYHEWERLGDIQLTRNEDEIAKYNRKVQVERLAGILDQVTASRRK